MAKIAIVATGGSRAPSQLELAERFLRDGHEVRCLATRNALRFISSYIARRPRKLPFYLRLYRPELRETVAYFKDRPTSVPHISEAKWADVFVMCPASCNSVGKLTAGVADNYPLLVLRAAPRDKRVIVVPSMNPEMWYDPQFQRNVDLLNATEKYRVVCPSRGTMLSGDVGFGAQASFEAIVAETYRALGVGSDIEDALAGGSTVPWEDARVAEDGTPRKDIVLIDEDVDLREQLARALEREHPGLRIHQFSQPGQALAALDGVRPALIFTELSFSGGAAAKDLIEYFRGPGDREVQIIATSAQDRREVGAEALARHEVMYLPKPLNVPFAVGMIAGSLAAAPQQTRARKRRLLAGEVLFREGEIGTELYVVETGQLILSKQDGDGQVELTRLGEKELLGEMAFFGDAERSATVVAAEETVLVEIDIEDVREYIERQPAWMHAILRTLVRRLSDTNARFAAHGATGGDEAQTAKTSITS